MDFKANELAKTTIDKTIAAIERRFVGSNQTIVAKAMQMFDVQTFGADYGKARSPNNRPHFPDGCWHKTKTQAMVVYKF